ncbi:MAG: hypothetical protein KAW51_02735 [Candidatus Lokiarchaeota archaeon]|nr:hypothetical protein [Candidatus Lokiarchaeota archaeon]
MNEKKPIPEEVALQICEEVRERNKKKKLSFAKVQCWGCMKYSLKKNDIRHRCIFAEENNRGCHLVNKIFDSRY